MKKQLFIFLLALLPFMASAQTDRTFPIPAFTGIDLLNGTISISPAGKVLVNGQPITAAQQALVDSVGKSNTSGITSNGVYLALLKQYQKQKFSLDSATQANAALANKAAGDSAKVERFRVPFDPAYLTQTSNGIAVDIAKTAAGVAQINGSGGQTTALIPTITNNTTGTSLTTTWTNTGALFYNLLQYSSDYSIQTKIYSGTGNTYGVTGLTAGSSYNFVVQPVYGSAVTAMASVDNSVASQGYTVMQYFDFSSLASKSIPSASVSTGTKKEIDGLKTALYNDRYDVVPANGILTIPASYGEFAIYNGDGIQKNINYKITLYNSIFDSNKTLLIADGNGTIVAPVKDGNNVIYNFSSPNGTNNIQINVANSDTAISALKLEKQN